VSIKSSNIVDLLSFGWGGDNSALFLRYPNVFTVSFCAFRAKLFHFHYMLRPYALPFMRRTWFALQYEL
jgi:hypothetical protein